MAVVSAKETAKRCQPVV